VTRRCGYWTPEVTAELGALYDRIIGQLITVFRHPEDWVKPA
jgi:hypothetical protein